MNSEKNFAIVNYSRQWDGTAIAARIYHNTLVELGYEPSWYQLADSFDVQDYMQFPKIIRGSRFPLNSVRPGWDRLVFFPVKRSFITEKNVFLSDPTLIRTAFGKNFMVKVHDVNPLTKYREKWTSWAMFKYSMPKLKSAASLIVTTDYMKRVISSYYPDLERISVVTEPVTWNTLSVIEENVRNLDETGNKQILYVAADRPYKNIRKFLDIAAEFQRRAIDDFHFTLVTKPKDTTLAYFKTLGLKNTKILTNVEDMKEVYSKTNLLVYPSLYEGFGRPIVEAMSYGIPSISLKIDPFNEIIRQDGILLDKDDLAVWVEAIQYLSEKEKYAIYSSRAKKAYESRYSIGIFESALNNAFKKFLEG